jgi:hypothetical protein
MTLNQLEYRLYKQLFWSLKRVKDKQKCWQKIDELYREINSYENTNTN